MTVTINHDEFVDEPLGEYQAHNILYGEKGWTDQVDDATIDLLVNTGAVALDRVVSGAGFESRIYVSVKGVGPR